MSKQDYSWLDEILKKHNIVSRVKEFRKDGENVLVTDNTEIKQAILNLIEKREVRARIDGARGYLEHMRTTHDNQPVGTPQRGAGDWIESKCNEYVAQLRDKL